MESFINRITSQPEVCHGAPTIRSMRYPVSMILDLLSSGMTIELILEDYSLLEREDILACLEYASILTNVKSIQKIVA